jgi:hypothetical protein
VSGLDEQAQQFAGELNDLLQAVLPRAPDVLIERQTERLVVRPEPLAPLHINGERIATLDIRVRCRLDSRGQWLAVDQSSYVLSADLDRTPVLRFDYVRDAHTAPSAHVQLHAHRGALSHLLSKAGHPHAHDMSKLHIPVGGARYRPAVEDVLQFLVQECQFDALPDWRDAVDAGRERWRRRQACAVARDFPHEAARTLRDLGYLVENPPAAAAPSLRALRAW